MGFDIGFDLGDSHIFVQQVRRLSELLSRSTLRERKRESERDRMLCTYAMFQQEQYNK